MFSTLTDWWKRSVYVLTGKRVGEEPAPDPELLLIQAQTEMREVHAKNRERAMQVITQKNNLQQMAEDTQRTIDNLQKKAELAERRGDIELVRQILKEIQGYETTLQMTRTNLEQAIETSEAVKNAIKREDEKIRQKTAEALALKAQWKNSQIQIAMNKALDGVYGVDDTEQRFGKARRRIHEANASFQAINTLLRLSERGIEALREKARAARETGDFEAETTLLREIEQSEAAFAHLYFVFDHRKTSSEAPEETTPFPSDALLTVVVVVVLLFLLLLLAWLFTR